MCVPADALDDARTRTGIPYRQPAWPAVIGMLNGNMTGLPTRHPADREDRPAVEQSGVSATPLISGALSRVALGGGAAHDQWPHDELALCIAQGEKGDAGQARRAAEIFELVDDFARARIWWHRAAELGDADAADYIRLIILG